MSNAILRLLVTSLAPKFPCLRFIVTLRDCGNICESLEGCFGSNLTRRHVEEFWTCGECSDKRRGVMVYHSLSNGGRIKNLQTATLEDLHAAYELLFHADREGLSDDREGLSDDREGLSDDLKLKLSCLLNVLIAAREPISLSLLQQLDLLDAVSCLPSALFYTVDHHVQFIHMTLVEWLRGKTDLISVSSGHATLSHHLVKSNILRAQEEDFLVSPFAAKNAIFHLAMCVNSGIEDKETLDVSLQSWSFIRSVVASGQAAGLIRDLFLIIDPSPYVQISLNWLRGSLLEFTSNPQEMEAITLQSCPLGSVKYEEALALLRPTWTTLTVLSGSSHSTSNNVVLSGHTYEVMVSSFSPDGRFLATGSWDGSAKVWRLDTADCLVTLRLGARVDSLSWSSHGHYLATAIFGGGVKIWDIRSGRCALFLPDLLSIVCFSPQQSSSCFASARGLTILVHDLASDGGMVSELSASPEDSSVTSLCWSSHDLITAGSDGGRVTIFEASSRIARVASFPAHDGAISSLQMTNTTDPLVLTSSDKIAKLWRLKEQQMECLSTIDFSGQSFLYGMVKAVAFHPTGEYFAIARNDNKCSIHKIDNPDDQVALFTDHASTSWMTSPVNGVVFSPDGEILVTSGGDNTARIYGRWMDHSLNRPSAELAGHSSALKGALICNKVGLIATASLDNSIKLWRMPSEPSTSPLVSRTLIGHTSAIHSISVSADGLSLASGSWDGTSRIWDLETGDCVNSISGSSEVQAVSFSPSGYQLAILDSCSVGVWDISSASFALKVEGFSWPNTISWSQDGRFLAVGSKDVMVFSPSSDNPSIPQTLPPYDQDSAVYSSVWSSDGLLLAIGLDKGTIIVYETIGWSIHTLLVGHKGVVNDLVFIRDQTLASASGDMTGRVWDVKSGKCTAILHGHSSGINTISCSANGEQIITGGADCTARVWTHKPW